MPRVGVTANLAARSLAELTVRRPTADHRAGLATGSAGHTVGMVDEVWLEAAAAVGADAAAELRSDAAEVFAAEAARTRLVDLRGSVRIRLRCGETVQGTVMADDPIDAHITLSATTPLRAFDDGSSPAFLVPTGAVVHIDGSYVDLRQEVGAQMARTLGSWLRERWADGEIVRILDRSGVRHSGVLTFVGADHVRLDSSRCIPWAAVDAWAV